MYTPMQVIYSSLICSHTEIPLWRGIIGVFVILQLVVFDSLEFLLCRLVRAN